MKLTRFWLLGFPVFVARDNEVEETDSEGNDQNIVPDDNDGILTDGDGKTFTQEDVNKIVVQRNKALKSQYQKLESQYQGLLKEKSLTQEQRSQLEKDLQNVQAQLRTREEQARHEAKQREMKFGETLKEKEQQANYYKSLYENSTIEREIAQAAAKHDGYNAQQFISLVAPRTKVVEELNDQGQKTGRLVARVEQTVKGEDGTPTTVQLTVDDAIAQMKEDTNFANLFKSNVARGIGNGTDNAAGARLDPTKLTAEEYIANKDAIRKQMGYKPRR